MEWLSTVKLYALVTCHIMLPHVGQSCPRIVSLSSTQTGGRWRCLSRLCLTASLVLDLLDVLDLPGRTAELARTYGIDFFSVINRWGRACHRCCWFILVSCMCRRVVMWHLPSGNTLLQKKSKH